MAALVFNELWAHRLRKLVEGQIEHVAGELVVGVAVRDIESYRERVGKVAAYRDCLELIEEAAKEPEDKRED